MRAPGRGALGRRRQGPPQASSACSDHQRLPTNPSQGTTCPPPSASGPALPAILGSGPAPRLIGPDSGRPPAYWLSPRTQTLGPSFGPSPAQLQGPAPSKPYPLPAQPLSHAALLRRFKAKLGSSFWLAGRTYPALPRPFAPRSAHLTQVPHPHPPPSLVHLSISPYTSDPHPPAAGVLLDPAPSLSPAQACLGPARSSPPLPKAPPQPPKPGPRRLHPRTHPVPCRRRAQVSTWHLGESCAAAVSV